MLATTFQVISKRAVQCLHKVAALIERFTGAFEETKAELHEYINANSNDLRASIAAKVL